MYIAQTNMPEANNLLNMALDKHAKNIARRAHHDQQRAIWIQSRNVGNRRHFENRILSRRKQKNAHPGHGSIKSHWRHKSNATLSRVIQRRRDNRYDTKYRAGRKNIRFLTKTVENRHHKPKRQSPEPCRLIYSANRRRGRNYRRKRRQPGPKKRTRKHTPPPTKRLFAR